MKRLYRSRDNRILAGFCGGIGEYADADPNIIRLIWVVVTIISLGIGIIVYLAAWSLVPEAGTEPAEPEPAGG